MPPLTVEEDQVEGAVVVRIGGDVDSASADALRDSLRMARRSALQHPARLLVVDLEGVTYFGSAALNAMLDCRDEAATQGISVKFVAAQPSVTRPMAVTKLDEVLTLYPTLATALRRDGSAPP